FRPDAKSLPPIAATSCNVAPRALALHVAVEEGRDLLKSFASLRGLGLIYCWACDRPSNTCRSASTPARRSFRWVRTVRLRNKSRVPEIRIVGGKPLRSP